MAKGAGLPKLCARHGCSFGFRRCSSIKSRWSAWTSEGTERHEEERVSSPSSSSISGATHFGKDSGVAFQRSVLLLLLSKKEAGRRCQHLLPFSLSLSIERLKQLQHVDIHSAIHSADTLCIHSAGMLCPDESAQNRRSLAPHLPGLLNDRLPFQGVQLRDDVPAGLPPGKDASAGALGSDSGPDLFRPPALVLGQVREVRPVALPGVEHVVPELAARLQHRLDGLDGRLGETTGLECRHPSSFAVWLRGDFPVRAESEFWWFPVRGAMGGLPTHLSWRWIRRAPLSGWTRRLCAG